MGPSTQLMRAYSSEAPRSNRDAAGAGGFSRYFTDGVRLKKMGQVGQAITDRATDTEEPKRSMPVRGAPNFEGVVVSEPEYFRGSLCVDELVCV